MSAPRPWHWSQERPSSTAYAWNTAGLTNGDYLAVVSYAADGNTFNGKFLERIRLGDTNITGPVALASLVALNSTVAKDATVAHITDLQTINPNTSTVVLAIQSAVNALPNTLASQDSISLLTSLLTDVHDGQFGTWSVDKTQSPKVLTFYRLDDSVLATYGVTEDQVSLSCRAQHTHARARAGPTHRLLSPPAGPRSSCCRLSGACFAVSVCALKSSVPPEMAPRLCSLPGSAKGHLRPCFFRGRVLLRLRDCESTGKCCFPYVAL